MRHELPIRIFYEDTDAAGVVYHARYLNFADRGRTELLRERGIVLHRMAEEQKRVFLVRRLEISYLRPLHLNELVTVATTLIKSSAYRALLHQVFERDGVPCAKMEVELVCLDQSTSKPACLPLEVINALGAFSCGATQR